MKIGFDSKRLLFNQTGLGNYSRQWVEALLSFNSIELELYAPDYGKFHDITVISPEIRQNFLNGLYKGFWRSFQMGKVAQNNGCDIFHGLSNEIPIGKIQIPRICTIHDVIFKEYPDYYSPIDRSVYNYKTRYACTNAEAIIVTSETTKLELLKYYDVNESKIHVVYQSINPRFKEVNWDPQTENPYFLYYSSFNPRKNQLQLIRAFADIVNSCDFNLIIAGNGRDFNAIKQLIDELSLTERVFINQSPSDDEIIQLLVKSSGFVYPSLQEGFGIPLVEAANVGVPIIVSDIPIFRELSSNSALDYFDPRSQWEMSKSLLKLIEFNNSKQKSVFDFKELIGNTNSENMAKKAIEIYKSVL